MEKGDGKVWMGQRERRWKEPAAAEKETENREGHTKEIRSAHKRKYLGSY